MTTENQLEFKGDLRRHPVPELLAEFLQNRLSGSIRLESGDKKSVIYLEAGEVVFVVSNERRFRLFEILLEQRQIEKNDLAGIDGFTNDLHLAKNLVENGVMTKPNLDAVLGYQMARIVESSFDLKSGEFIFSAASRIKSALHFKVPIRPLIESYVNGLDTNFRVSRFDLSEEKYALTSGVDLTTAELTVEEGFVVSRLSANPQSLNDLMSVSGMSNEQLLPAIYKLWMTGFLNRLEWRSAISKETAAKITGTNFELKTAARSFEDDQALAAKEEADRIAREKTEEEAKLKLTQTRAEVSLEEYLEAVENAATHYEIFDISPDSKVSAIKAAYFALAKRFHPDLFFRQVDQHTLTRIQDAFTEIAKAYDTLKDEESREVYDFKLRKVIEQLREAESGSDAELTKEDIEMGGKSRMAADNFDAGYDYLLNENIVKALPHLGRAVHLEEGNARYHAFYGQALSHDPDSYRRAEAEYQKAIKAEPNNSQYRFMLAELLVEIGHTKRAIGELNRLLKKFPDNKDARRLLDSLEQ